ncbi:MAG TPA: hypothetical protein VND94_21550 [Terriglobia bacterium]|nr:hypothetical protein [Terriglobia bacterium]
MSLEMKQGCLIGDRPGFHLQAEDDGKPVTFTLAAGTACLALGIDPHTTELLDRILHDRLPEIWQACRTAYAEAQESAADVDGTLILTEAHFRTPARSRIE